MEIELKSIPPTYTYNRSFSWLGRSGWVKLVLWDKTSISWIQQDLRCNNQPNWILCLNSQILIRTTHKRTRYNINLYMTRDRYNIAKYREYRTKKPRLNIFWSSANKILGPKQKCLPILENQKRYCKVSASKTRACGLIYNRKIHLWSSPYLQIIQYILNSTQQKKKKWDIKIKQDKVQLRFRQNS
jgi:hypothetical protein